jgi:23S rRNA pseudouridine1911/1915/1917 synthase
MKKTLYSAAGLVTALSLLLLVRGHEREAGVCPGKDDDYWKFVGLQCLKPYPGFDPNRLSFSVIYEDEYVLVVSKGSNEAIHPRKPESDDTLLNEAASYLRAKGDAKGVGYMSRIDKGTSGLIALGKTKDSFEDLRGQVISREFQAYYFALAEGAIGQTTYVDYPIGPDDLRRGMKLAVAGSTLAMKAYPDRHSGPSQTEGNPAYTYFYPAHACKGSTFLKVKILTGVTHQIRVHSQAIHHPLVGDPLYGGDTARLKRQFLHKGYLAFRHPHSKKFMEFHSPLPEDLRSTMTTYCGKWGRDLFQP